MLEGYNLITKENAGLGKVLCVWDNFFSYLCVALNMLIYTIYNALLSEHLKKEFKTSDAQVGLYFSFANFTYLLGCILTPLFLSSIPPYIQFAGAFFSMALGACYMGPSKVFDMP